MKRHSDKAFYNAVVKELKTKTFIDNKERALTFSHWYYEKGKLNIFFRYEEDDNKMQLIQLYYQHLHDYKNTLSMINGCFSKVV